jgi:hypothetical protein
VHDGPQLPSHLVLRVVHVQDLRSKIQGQWYGKTREFEPIERNKNNLAMRSPDSDTPSSRGRSTRARRAG